jgi:hypothetical protein
MLVSDGSADRYSKVWIQAPYHPAVADYAVEAEIQWLIRTCGNGDNEFGIIVRGVRGVQDKGGILGGITCRFGGTNAAIQVDTGGSFNFSYFGKAIAKQSFASGSNIHKYRLQVRGNVIKLKIDGSPFLEVADNYYLSSGKIGLFSVGAQINVRPD